MMVMWRDASAAAVAPALPGCYFRFSGSREVRACRFPQFLPCLAGETPYERRLCRVRAVNGARHVVLVAEEAYIAFRADMTLAARMSPLPCSALHQPGCFRKTDAYEFGRLVCRLTPDIDLQNITRVPRFGESIDHQKTVNQTLVPRF